MKNWVDYWIADEETGEEFFVEVDANQPKPKDEVYEILDKNFGKDYRMLNLRIVGVIPPEEAEMMGYDTY